MLTSNSILQHLVASNLLQQSRLNLILRQIIFIVAAMLTFEIESDEAYSCADPVLSALIPVEAILLQLFHNEVFIF